MRRKSQFARLTTEILYVLPKMLNDMRKLEHCGGCEDHNSVRYTGKHVDNTYEHPTLIESVYPRAYQLAKKFHEIYEFYAPKFTYETRKDTKEFVPNSTNGRLMARVCYEMAEEIEESERTRILALIEEKAILFEDAKSGNTDGMNKKELELLSWCYRCHRKFEEMGEVLKWGKYYPACRVKHIDGTEENLPESVEIVEAICKNCMVEVNTRKYDSLLTPHIERE